MNSTLEKTTPLVGTILNEDMVFQEGRADRGDRPQGLWLYSERVRGNQAFVGAAADILAGKLVSFAVCEREPAGTAAPPKVREVFTFGMGEGGDPDDGYAETEPRFVGENGSPDGAGSHSLIPCQYGAQCTSLPHIAVALATFTSRVLPNGHVFRLPNL